MPGSLNDILPEPISEENERVIEDVLRGKARVSAQLAVSLLHAMEERFGPEAREVVREMAKPKEAGPPPDAAEPDADLHELCAIIDRGATGYHRFERVIDEPDRIGLHMTRCLHADLYRELGEPELGMAICATDAQGLKALHPRLAFTRTKTLMAGDELCDPIIYLED